MRDGPRCSRLSLQAAPTLRPRSGRTGSHEPACPPLSLSHLLNKSTVFFKYMPADAYLEFEFQMASWQFHLRALNASGDGGMLKRCNTDIHTKN